MASAGGRADASLRERLFVEPFRYGFFQAVRLLQLLAPDRVPVGLDGPPHAETVRFQAEASLGFPASEIRDLEPGEDGAPPEMVVRFMGLTGPQGALPRHYTAHVIERLRLRDRAFAAFLDIFNHRLVSLLFRAWEKYRLHLRVRGDALDTLSTYLFSLFGLGTRGLRGRLEVPDRALLLYTGLLAQRPRSATGLAALLGDYFDDLPVRIEQFVGQWLELDPESQTSLRPFGGNTALGVDTVIGSRVWQTQSCFRVRMGPMTYPRFCGFLPCGRASRELLDLARFYVGQEFDMIFQLVVLAADVPPCTLGSTGPQATRLGWSTWLTSRPPATDPDDVSFHSEGLAAYHRRHQEERAS